jgi:hypothetical protein
MNLPQKLPLDLMQTRWASILNPLIANALNDIQILSNVALIDGTNVLNHSLGRPQQGWFLTDIQGASIIYRSAPFNSTTLTLVSSAAVTVSIGVF